jgi:hypothetical protein
MPSTRRFIANPLFPIRRPDRRGCLRRGIGGAARNPFLRLGRRSGCLPALCRFARPSGHRLAVQRRTGVEQPADGYRESRPPTKAKEFLPRQEDPNPGIFMHHLRANWNDIHDVIMRFHHKDPALKGLACISMVWREGALASASVDSNSTGNPAFGPALIEAMKPWRIEGLAEGWAMTVPFRTAIHGSDRAEFAERGIFIRTLIRPGVWRLECSRDGYSPTVIDGLTIEKGQHVKRAITLSKS